MYSSAVSPTLWTLLENFAAKVFEAIEEIKAGQQKLKHEILDEIGNAIDRKLKPLADRIKVLEDLVLKDFDPEKTLVIKKLDTRQREVKDDVEEMIDRLHLEEEVNVVRVKKITPKVGAPLIKAELGSVKEKIDVLRAKQNLKDMDQYKDVYIRSSQSYIERMNQI